MRFSFMVVAAIVALSLFACTDPTESATRTGPEDTVLQTPAHSESSPTVAPPTSQGPENTLIETPEYAGVIVSENGASEFGYVFDESSTTFWEPSPRNISRAEERIRQYLVSVRDNPKLDSYQKEKLAFIVENLDQYRRQYVGIDVDGERRIWVNAFFSDDSFPEWKRLPVDVDGGGNRYWQIEYDLVKDECSDFYVHGES